ncbi:MAG TPA: type II secretion system major pseudopilin GspG [Bacillota bacterium]
MNGTLRRKDEEGFTLFEVIAVLCLIAALTAVVGPSIWNRLERGRVQTAQVQVAMLKNCLNDYRLDMGVYPSTEEGLESLRRPPFSGAERWNGPYIDGPVPKDPWGNDYVYIYPGTGGANTFELYSYGADGQEGGTGVNADIRAWTETEERSFEGIMEY